MREFVWNSWWGLVHSWLVAFSLVIILSACSVKKSDGPVGSKAPSGHGDWQTPGLVDQSGAPIEVPKPSPATGRTLDVTDFGADPNPDSHDDAAAIRAALDEAKPGDEVWLPAGTYDLRSTDPADKSANIVLRSGVNLRGEGRERTVLLTSFDGEHGSRVIRGSGIHDVIIADFTITSRYEGPFGDDPNNGNAGGGPMYGVYLGAHKGKASSKVLVENLGIRRFERHGISLKASREVTLSGNYISGATAVGHGGQGYGIAIEGSADQHDPDAANDSRHNIVTRNTFDGRHLRHAILLQFPTHNNLVAENTIVGSLLDAIDLHGEGEYMNEIRNNTVIGGKRAGIALGNPGGSKNKHDATGPGNWVHSNDLIGNRQGVLVILGTPDTLIEDNWINAGDNSETGIEVRNAPGTELRGNLITGGTDGFWAIRLSEDRGTDGRGKGIPSGITIAYNVIRQAANGIRIDAGKDLNIVENIIDDIEGPKLRVADGIEEGVDIKKVGDQGESK
ncbi:right-handed parallel beta-helix repeat-containing protein [Bacillus sp. FJAT-29937]|uniref:right-handed parallel beta-helix repeat-containing protein n=1 Tax=Bacillus sp. FJAT-29937 TaxID=1720553 RepID=UPI00082E14BC|nr:right-handed parallel beta-helix repeat-containing protein [Bacillus sp. FJAT-29937]